MNTKRFLLIASIAVSINAIAQTNTFPLSGNVGIGITNPSSPLHILTNNSLETNILTLQNTSPWSNGQIHNIVWRDQVDGITGAIGMQYDRNGNVDFKIHSLYNGDYKNSSVTSFTVKGNGNVGIGTDNPQANLQIGNFNNASNSKICIPGVYNFEQVKLGQYGNGACGLEFINHASLLASYGIRLLSDIDHFYGLQIQMATPANSYNELNYKTQLAITTNGNVGIGTTTPENKLSIEDGSSNHVGLSISNNIYGSNQGNFFFFKTGDSYIVTDQKNAGVIESYNDLILSAASGTGVTAPSIKFQTGRNGYIGNTRMLIDNSGNVGIGTQNPAYKLDVLGTIRAKEVLVNLDGGADFVFEKDYKLPTIEHVATYVQENKHLPDIPSANEMTKNGVSMGDMQVKLLQKVEELTLYVIELKKEIETMKKKSIIQ